MIYINDKSKLKIFKTSNDFCVIIDFDKTITTQNSTSSMGIIPEYLGGECLEERIKIYNYFRPIELDYTLDLIKRKEILGKWTYKSLNMVAKHVESENVFRDAIQNCNLHLRDGAKDFFEDLFNRNIPIIIMSAGLGNIIEQFLKKENAYFENQIIISNFLKFEDKKVIIDTQNIVPTSNKEYKILPEKIKEILNKKDKILLCGDIIEDIFMINSALREKTLAIGFLDINIEDNLKIYNKSFDIVLSNNEDFDTINELLKEEINEEE